MIITAGNASFGTWLKKIVINKSIDEIRKAKDVISIDEADVEVADMNNEEENYIQVLSTRVEEIRKAIHALPDSYRIILTFICWKAMIMRKLPRSSDISYNLSRTRYSRARKKLLEFIGAGENSASNSKLN